ncbi:MAG TPA: hypothetical protein VES02_04245 [Dermatophilaceae bacterium]|nr:hypothetical protein [Dermatophilaceae bacterium]
MSQDVPFRSHHHRHRRYLAHSPPHARLPGSSATGSWANPARLDISSRLPERIGTQYVIGDDLTGNGVPAPL